MSSTPSYTARFYKAREFAVQSHSKQKYGIYHYQIHLGHTVGVLLQNGVNLSAKEGYVLLAAAWLHDVLEDTAVTQQELTLEFGEEVYAIVFAVTDGEGETREEKKEEVYKKLRTNPQAIIVKLADRIANVEFCIIHNNPKKLKLYKKEQKDLKEKVLPYTNTLLGKTLFTYLDKLLKESA